MAKRRAAEQIAKGFARDDDSSSEEEQTEGAPAAPEVLAGRKIAVPRSRLRKAADSQSASESSSANPFSGLTRPAAESSGANPFGFLNKPAEPSAKPLTSTVSKTESSTTHSPVQLKLRALNSAFAAQVSRASSDSPFEDWTRMCEKYISYAKKVSEEAPNKSILGSGSTASTGLFGVKPAATNGSGAASDAKSPSGTDAGVKPQLTSSGFSFGSQVTAPKTFEFGGKTVDNTKTHASKPSGGFVFNPNGTGEIKTSPADDNDLSDMKDTDNGDKSASAESEKPKPVFSFGAASTGPAKPEVKEAPKPFSFGATSDSAPKFSFGSKEGSEKPAFTFGQPKSADAGKSEDSKSKDTKPAFSFGAPAQSDDKKPAFTFGNPAASSEEKSQETKPAFSFGAVTDNKPSFTFGKPAAAPNAEPKTEEAKGKPVFSFGAPKQDDAKPAFSFGAPGSTGSSGQSPAFSFGSKDSKPAFSFGPKDTKDGGEKPKFQFGAANKSEFSFGTGVNPFGAKPNEDAGAAGPKVDAAWKPDHKIKIATVDDVSGGASGNGTTGNGASTEGEPSEEQNDPQTDLGGPGPGEEDEDCVYEKKSKAFELAAGEYKPLGLGFLRILVHKESKKARALMRAEGSGRVLLNIPIRKEFNYTVVGKGQVKLLDVKPGEDAPTVYLARVKTEEDGNELKDKLQEVKN